MGHDGTDRRALRKPGERLRFAQIPGGILDGDPAEESAAVAVAAELRSAMVVLRRDLSITDGPMDWFGLLRDERE